MTHVKYWWTEQIMYCFHDSNANCITIKESVKGSWSIFLSMRNQQCFAIHNESIFPIGQFGYNYD